MFQARLRQVYLLPIARHVSTETASAIDRLKHPSRGGRNLTARYKQLQRSVRGREAYSQQLRDNQALHGPAVASTTASVSRKEPMRFRGFAVPEEPQAPKPDECCMSGCAVCVHDLYQESLEAYDKAVIALRASLTAAAISEEEWPSQIQPGCVKERKKSVNLSAFEELERKLKSKSEVLPRPVEERTTSAPRKNQAALKAGAIVEALSWVAFSKR